MTIAPGTVRCPAYLAGAAKEAWEQWIEPRVGIGFYEPAEAPMLAMWCVMLARFFAVDEVTPFEGVYEEEDAYGNRQFKKHPGATVLQQTSAEFRALSSRLGLDPLARMALGDALRAPGQHGPQLPQGAPPVYAPPVAVPDPAPSRARKPQCAEHGRRWRKKCAGCQRIVAAEAA